MMSGGSAREPARHEAPPRGVAAAFLATLLVTIIVIGATILADIQTNMLHRAHLRASASAELEPIRSALEIAINSDIQLLRGIAAAISAEAAPRPDHFERLAGTVFRDGSHLRSLAYAPGFVVARVYPVSGNQAAIGLDYRTDPRQSAAAMRVRDEKRPILAGPLALVQGGSALVARYPIFAPPANGARVVSGILAGVLDIEAIYRDAGLQSLSASLDIALAGRNGNPADIFFGDPAILVQDPVTMTIALPGGDWTISAVPKSGWNAAPENQTTIRLLLAVAGLLVIVPTYLTSLLLRNRQKTLLTLRASEARLQALSHRLGLALSTSDIGIWEFDVDQGHLLWDEKMFELYGKEPGFVPSLAAWRETLLPEDAARTQGALQAAATNGTPFLARFRIRLETGEIRHMSAVGTLDPSATGRRVLVGVNWDVTADTEKTERLDAARRQMEYNALHDPLTGLANRRALDQLLSAHPPGSTPLTLLHIDLDRFKEINDTGGHAMGDAVLRHTAAILTALVDPDDVVARIGGDEFVIVRRNSPEARSEALADAIGRAMATPLVWEGQDVRMAVSIGIAHHQGDEPLTQLLIDADLALYQAKQRGRNRYETFTPALRTAALSTRRMADDILRGLEDDDFVAYYQPQFCPQTLALTGVEALARWNHPTRGLLTPQSFLKAAEAINIVARIDQRVLELALVQSQRWDAAGLRVPKISVNISHARLSDETLAEKLALLDIPKGRFSFELLESIFLDEEDGLLFENVTAIKALGIDIEIDDFGSGYASITSLLNLTPRRLKIDRKLVTPMLDSPRQKQLVSSIVEIGRSLGIEVIAEGVETRAHIELLRLLGCDGLQGYALAEPMSADHFLDYLQGQRAQSA